MLQPLCGHFALLESWCLVSNTGCLVLAKMGRTPGWCLYRYCSSAFSLVDPCVAMIAVQMAWVFKYFFFFFEVLNDLLVLLGYQLSSYALESNSGEASSFLLMFNLNFGVANREEGADCLKHQQQLILYLWRRERGMVPSCSLPSFGPFLKLSHHRPDSIIANSRRGTKIRSPYISHSPPNLLCSPSE